MATHLLLNGVETADPLKKFGGRGGGLGLMDVPDFTRACPSTWPLRCHAPLTQLSRPQHSIKLRKAAVRLCLPSFTYQAGSWKKPRRVLDKVEWYLGEFYPRVGFIVTNMSGPAENVVAFYEARA